MVYVLMELLWVDFVGTVMGVRRGYRMACTPREQNCATRRGIMVSVSDFLACNQR